MKISNFYLQCSSDVSLQLSKISSQINSLKIDILNEVNSLDIPEISDLEDELTDQIKKLKTPIIIVVVVAGILVVLFLIQFVLTCVVVNKVRH